MIKMFYFVAIEHFFKWLKNDITNVQTLIQTKITKYILNK